MHRFTMDYKPNAKPYVSGERRLKASLRGIGLVIMCAVLFGSFCWAQEPSGPEMVLDETDFDAGQIL
jgi:hypothetical protein